MEPHGGEFPQEEGEFAVAGIYVNANFGCEYRHTSVLTLSQIESVNATSPRSRILENENANKTGGFS